MFRPSQAVRTRHEDLARSLTLPFLRQLCLSLYGNAVLGRFDEASLQEFRRVRLMYEGEVGGGRYDFDF